MNNQIDLPTEKFFPIKDNNEFLLRLIVGSHLSKFWVEADIVSKESHKIIYHLGSKHNIENYFDSVQAGLSFYTKWKK